MSGDHLTKTSFKVILVCLILLLSVSKIFAQDLQSTNYKIVDPTINPSGGITESTNYGLLSSIGDSTADSRLTSGTYALGSGFPNGIQANEPTIRCAETSTTSGTTSCTDFPNTNGAQGECGTPGCYDRAKIEINPQNNPLDTLYLIALTDPLGQTFYIQSDHTLSTTYDINDYMTLCSFQGKDSRSGSGCVINTDPDWDADLQSTNVYQLAGNTTYATTVRALNGDFTETQYSSSVNFTTVYPTLSLDLDIGTSSSANTSAPYSLNLGTLSTTVTTPADQIWMDIGTNLQTGMTAYVKDVNDGLKSGINIIPSQSEDLSTDPTNDGGFGLKISSSTQSALGPLLKASAFDTVGADQVGAVSTSNAVIFSTNTVGLNNGQVTSGRAGIYLKAKSVGSTISGAYSDTLIFSLVAN